MPFSSLEPIGTTENSSLTTATSHKLKSSRSAASIDTTLTSNLDGSVNTPPEAPLAQSEVPSGNGSRNELEVLNAPQYQTSDKSSERSRGSAWHSSTAPIAQNMAQSNPGSDERYRSTITTPSDSKSRSSPTVSSGNM